MTNDATGDHRRKSTVSASVRPRSGTLKSAASGAEERRKSRAGLGELREKLAALPELKTDRYPGVRGYQCE